MQGFVPFYPIFCPFSACLILFSYDIIPVRGEIVMRATRKGNPVKLGIETLKREVRSKKVVLLMNHTALDQQGQNLIDVMPAWECEVVFLIGLEHGIRGNLYQNIRSGPDQRTGLYVHSIYNFSNPRYHLDASLFRDVDGIVATFQDAGVRHYTYIAMLFYQMNVLTPLGKTVWVLDRPNPIGGHMVEGGGMKKELFSSLGVFDYPLRHGMTIGELATMYNQTVLQGKCDLRVIPMEGWERTMWYEDTGLIWIPASPNIPTPMTFLAFATTGLLQNSGFSCGVGTTYPFFVFGSPATRGNEIASQLNALDLPGFIAIERYFQPSFDQESDQVYHGTMLHIYDREAFRPYRTQLEILSLLGREYPSGFHMENRHFNRRNGSMDVYDMIIRQEPPHIIIEKWAENAKRFEETRQPYLLY
jgi:uncharacterized protein YbbC (DUF1343 family)